MTDHADLIAEAREFAAYMPPSEATAKSLVFRLASAFEGVVRGRDEALAVIEGIVENSERVEGGPVPWVEIDAQVWDRYLDNPADALRAVRAEAWDEGYVAREFELPSVEFTARNPYRVEKGQG